MKLYSIYPESYAAYQSNLKNAREGFDLSLFVNKRKECLLDGDGIGHVYIYGPLLRDSTPIDRELGCTDYAQIITDLETVTNQGAKAILLHVDSGGGTVAGAIEAAKAIENAPVPVVTYVSGMACSAAYKLSCAATAIIATESAVVGNIGTIMVLADPGEYYAKLGVSFTAFTNDDAKLKSIGHVPGLTDEQRTFLKESIQSAGDSFKSFVIENRPNIDGVCWQAGWYSGTEALNLGLIDAIGTEGEAHLTARMLHESFQKEN